MITLVTINCAVCDKPFQTQPREIAKGTRCCSWECRNKYVSQHYRGENHRDWEGKRRKANCLVCGKDFIAILHVHTGWQRFCSRKCGGIIHSQNISGKNHPNWKGGLSRKPYPIEFNQQLRRTILERDKRTCQLCGITDAECYAKGYRHLHIHHINHDKDNLSPRNLISLCPSCNSRTNYHREHWVRFFRLKLNSRFG